MSLRIALASVVSLFVTIGLFGFMGRLAQARAPAPPIEKPTPIRLAAPPPTEVRPAEPPRPVRVRPPEPRPGPGGVEGIRGFDPGIRGTGPELPPDLGPTGPDGPFGPPGAPGGPTREEARAQSAIPLVRIEPDYPPQAVDRGIEGWVVVRFVVAADGSVRAAQVVRSSHSLFEREALRAVERFRYQPQIEAGIAVESAQEVLLRFSLPHGSGGASPES
jgi:protein TonB